MGGFTLYVDLECDVFIEDIIHNLNSFNQDELLKLKEQIEYNVLKTNNRKDTNILVASTLDEEYKIEILKEMFYKFSWSELEDIKKKIM